MLGSKYKPITYPAEFVTFNRLLLIPAAETAFVDKLRQLLLHHLLDLGYSLVQAFFGRACNMEIQGRVLGTRLDLKIEFLSLATYRGRRHVLIRVVVSTRGNILRIN